MELTKEQRAFYEGLLRYKTIVHKNSHQYRVRGRIYKNRRYIRSRVLMTLKLNRILKISEIVKHKDGNTLNDSLENLYLVNKHDPHTPIFPVEQR